MISPEQIREDLSRVFQSAGAGSAQDRAAAQLLRILEILESRLDDDVAILRIIYLTDTEDQSVLPQSMYQMIAKIEKGELSRTDAKQQLAETVKAYEKTFREMGIIPTNPSVLFFTS